MAYRRTTFAPNEWYHCYSRGVDKRVVFSEKRDYERFLESLYLSNSSETIERGHFQHISHEKIFQLHRDRPLVAIGAYCLMPTHYHILLQEIADDGVTRFMQKLGTSYTMYFNVKYKRIGGLFTKPFRSKHVDSDRYLKRVAQYIHLNPAELFERKWKKGHVEHIERLKESLIAYKFSSFRDYRERPRPEKAILDQSAMKALRDMPQVDKLIAEMRQYYEELPW